jgi:Uma2 family endonuclease
MSGQEFFELCQLNRDLRMERTSGGDLLILPPAGGRTGKVNFTLGRLFGDWVDRDGTGLGFDSSTGFTLPNGAIRSPDVAWVKRSRWESLSQSDQEGFPPLAPDFVVELRSPSDALDALKAKMEEYLANGTDLGWLIDPLERKVHVYRRRAEVRSLDNPSTISGDPLLPGFTLDLERLWG